MRQARVFALLGVRYPVSPKVDIERANAGYRINAVYAYSNCNALSQMASQGRSHVIVSALSVW
jgi:hypothetical protein